MSFKAFDWLVMVAVGSGLALVAVSLAGFYLVRPAINDTRALKFSSDTQTIIVGASHGAVSFDPSLLSNAVNVAQSGELTLYTYYKLLRILELNSSLKTVIMPFAPLHLGGYQETGLFQGNSASRNHIMTYYPLIKAAQKKAGTVSNVINQWSQDYLVGALKYDWGLPLAYMDDLGILYRHYIKGTSGTNLRFRGGFTAGDGSHLSDDAIQRKVKFYFGDGQAVPSQVAIDIFKAIVKSTNSHGIKLILVYTPHHQKFRKLIPETLRVAHLDMVNWAKVEAPSLMYIDFHQIALADEFFLDGDHLNRKGASVFMKRIQDHLASHSAPVAN